MDGIVIGIGVVVALIIAAASVHMVLTWADRRGWVWYRNADRSPPQSLGLLEEIYQPSVEHMVEYEIGESTRADQAESGGPQDASDPDR